MKSKKKNARRHQIQMRQNGGSLNFNFFLLLNLVVDENWVFADIVCCSSSFKNDAVYDVPIYSNFFLWTADLLKVTTFFVHR